MKCLGQYRVSTTKKYNDNNQYFHLRNLRTYLYIDLSIGCHNRSNLDKNEYGFVIKNGFELFYNFSDLEVEGLDVAEIEEKYKRISTIEDIID